MVLFEALTRCFQRSFFSNVKWMPLLRWHSQSSLSNTLPIMRFAVGKVKNPQPWVNSKTSSIYSFLVVSFHPNIVLCIGRASWLLREKRQVCIKSLRAVPSLSGMWFISSLVGSWFSNTLKYDFSHLSHYFLLLSWNTGFYDPLQSI